ncbi:MAG: Crp/Fnr family transcriptional regulator [Rhizomicrobium sp.]
MRGGKTRAAGAGRDPDLQIFLRSVFSCAPEVASEIAARASVKGYPVKAVILKQGEPGAISFLMIAGVAHALAYGPEGRLVMLQEFAPGDFFGAVVQAEPAQQDADIVAMEAVRAALFRALDFLRLAETHACIGIALSRMLIRHLRAATSRMAERTTLSAAGRVCMELLRQARLGDGRTLDPAPVLSALAVRVNSTRETVSRTIHGLERRGILSRQGRALVIVAPQRLEDLAI